MTTIVFIAIDLRRNRHKVIATGMDTSLALRVIVYGISMFWGLVYDLLCSRCGSHLISSHSKARVSQHQRIGHGDTKLMFFDIWNHILFHFRQSEGYNRAMALLVRTLYQIHVRGTDVNFRALALINSDSSKPGQSLDSLVLTPCKTIE